MGQEGILLAFVETVYFIDKENRFQVISGQSFPGMFDNFSDLLDA